MSDKLTTEMSTISPLPEYWPDQQRPQSERAYWLPWPMAVLLVPLLWLMPKRMGPHFAAVRWPGVIVGHLFWTIYGLGCVFIAFDAPKYGWVAYLAGQSPGQSEPSIWLPPTFSEIFRSPLALFTIQLIEGLHGIEDLIALSGLFVVIELGLILLAVMLLPYAASGERTRALFARCVKLTLWAPTSLVMFGLVLQTRIFFVPEEDLGNWERTIESTLPFYLLWVVWIWIRSSLRYAGPAEGPAWEPRQPQCEKCGYLLIGLTVNDKCPECGRPVADSMPSSRQATAFASSRGVLGQTVGFLRTYVRVIFDRDFYRKTRMHGTHANARRFAILSVGGSAPIICAVAMAVAMWFDRRIYKPSLDVWMEVMGYGSIYVALVSLLLLGVIGTIAYRPRLSRRTLQPHATVAFYHSAWLLPIMLSTIIMGALFAWLEVDEYFRALFGRSHIGQMWTVFFSLMIGLLMLGPVPILAFFRFTRGLRQVRFANA